MMIKDISEKNQFPKGFTFYQVLERIQYNLISIQSLVKEDIVKHDRGIGLISRNLLSDFIITGYIIKLSESEDEFYAHLYSLHNSDLKKMDAFVKMFEDAGLLENSKFSTYYDKYDRDNNIYKVIRDYINEFAIKPFPSTKTIIELFLKSEQNDIWVRQIQQGYDLWVYLSKYEHLGWNSYDVTRNMNIAKATKRLESIIFKTSIMTASCLEILNEITAMGQVIELIKPSVR